ncbi:penicillin acylase family protein, partial [Paracoccaceae bacterium]|nr:penicillin acylase family protein [Paracoccaceae bacterium]
MKILIKLIPSLILALTLVLISVLIFFFFLSYQSLPSYEKNLLSDSINNKIEIKNNLYAVPHIVGSNNEEVFFGLGYSHAIERFWQMNYLRRLSQGRLSEINGTSTILIDKFSKSLDLQKLAKSIFKNLSPKTQQILISYSKGVNLRLEEIRDRGLGRGSPEFFFLNPEVSPWSPIDSITIFKFIEFISSNKALVEIANTSLLFSNASSSKLSHIIDDTDEIRLRLKPILSQIQTNKSEYPQKNKIEHLASLFSPSNAGFSSNVFAADKSRTASRKSILSTNLILPLSSPAIWMLAHLELEETSVVGGTIAGIPIIFSGKNSNLAWGTSFSFVDDQDLYFERLHPTNDREYLSPTGYKEFNTQQKLIKVKDENTINYLIKRTKSRVIIPHEVYKMRSLVPDGYLISLAWTGFNDNDKTLETFLDLMVASTIKGFKSSLKSDNSFNLAFVIADKANIDTVLIGMSPKRKILNQTFGKAISPGWESKNQWLNDFKRLEKIIPVSNERGVIINTNNKILDRKFPNHLSFDWGDNQRLLRATKMINNRKFHTSESFKELQNDYISETARTLLPLIGKELWFQYENDDPNDVNLIKTQGLELLTNWNGDMNINSPEPLIYYTWISTFKKMLIEDEIISDTFSFDLISPLFLEKVLRNYKGAGIWCDVEHSEKKETCAE